MHTFSTLFAPLLCHRPRIIPKNRFLIVVTLFEADTIASPKINGWPNLHDDIFLMVATGKGLERAEIV